MSNGFSNPFPSMARYLTEDQLRDLSSRDQTTAATPEPKPLPSFHPAIADVVAAELIALEDPMAREVAKDIMARKAFGLSKYGTPLQPFNGRDVLNDLYQELLDATKYARVALYEASYLRQDTRASESLYENLKDLVVELHTQMDKRRNNGAADTKGNEARQG